jgi:hypothetical protein
MYKDSWQESLCRFAAKSLQKLPLFPDYSGFLQRYNGPAAFQNLTVDYFEIQLLYC